MTTIPELGTLGQQPGSALAVEPVTLLPIPLSGSTIASQEGEADPA